MPLSSLREAASVAPVALELRIGAHTDPGQVRKDKENEDRLLVFDLARRGTISAQETVVVDLPPRGVLLLVADGMGGMSGGEQASQMCADLLPEKLLDQLSGKGAARERLQQALVAAVEETNQIIFRRAASDIRLRGMGCTLTAALLAEDHLTVAQVGDSRAYLRRAGELTQLTRDQTVWESLRAAGKELDAALGQNQFRSMLLQAVGAQENVQVAITQAELQAGDWLVLCTDGLYRVVSTQEIGQILETKADPAQEARALTDLANQHGGPDNVSVVVCQVAGTSERQKRAAEMAGTALGAGR